MKFLSVALAATLSIAAPAAFADTSIDTTARYTASFSPFGNPNTSGFGQTFTVGADNTLTNYSLYLTGRVGKPLGFRSYVYAWNGSAITGQALYSSGPTFFNGSDEKSPTEFVFDTGNVTLASGRQYVAFLFSDVSSGEVTARMPLAGAWNISALPHGNFVYANVGNNFGALSQPWGESGDHDVWFKAKFVGAAVPEPATWAMMLLGFGMVGAAVRRRRQHVRVSFA